MYMYIIYSVICRVVNYYSLSLTHSLTHTQTKRRTCPRRRHWRDSRCISSRWNYNENPSNFGIGSRTTSVDDDDDRSEG
jgi:hypothetical protein